MQLDVVLPLHLCVLEFIGEAAKENMFSDIFNFANVFGYGYPLAMQKVKQILL